MIQALPQWRCHKVVGAFKIERIEWNGVTSDWLVYPAMTTKDVVPIVSVKDDYFRSRTSDNSRPLRKDEYIGGYLVQYEDGYLSWSPAKAFEEGYTRIE